MPWILRRIRKTKIFNIYKMKSSTYIFLIIALIAFLIAGCRPSGSPKPSSEFASVSQVDSGTPVAVQMTAYSTTLLADGKDKTLLRITVIDRDGREITSATNSLQIYVDCNTYNTTVDDDIQNTNSNGGTRITKSCDNRSLVTAVDTSGRQYFESKLENGLCLLDFYSGTVPCKIKVEVRSDKLWPASHEIHTIPADVVLLTPSKDQLTGPEGRTAGRSKKIDRMIGADISFLPEFEARGMKFYDFGTEPGKYVEKDAIEILRDHGFNYIRLRLFVNPENEKGYSPHKGFCGLSHTLDMARRVKKAGMKLLLNFHYSDYWADPQQQNKPLAWANLDFETLKDTIKEYTRSVLLTFADQNVLPDMVQIGNEVNHGILWPDGHISNLDNLAELLKAGEEGATSVAPDMPVMMHLALGGQNKEAVFWLDNMIARGVKFDIIGISYYPRWHGTLDDLKFNLTDLAGRYHKPLNVVEYATFKKEVHEIVFSLPDNLGTGTCIWEPLSPRWGGMFNDSGQALDVIMIYDKLSEKYLTDD
jgi:arabinogalactan endo-1,4-beta-galactosidase